MIQIYQRAFRLHHKKYLPQVLGWLLLGTLETPLSS